MSSNRRNAQCDNDNDNYIIILPVNCFKRYTYIIKKLQAVSLARGTQLFIDTEWIQLVIFYSNCDTTLLIETKNLRQTLMANIIFLAQYYLCTLVSIIYRYVNSCVFACISNVICNCSHFK